MLKKLKTYGVLFWIVLAITLSCTPKSYDYNATAVPIGLNYSYYNYGTGTSFTDGALIINIRSNSTVNYHEYYLIQVYGVGAYTLQSGYNQLFIPNVWANYYNFSIEKVCTAGTNSSCTSRTLTGLATINAEMTTVVDAWL